MKKLLKIIANVITLILLLASQETSAQANIENLNRDYGISKFTLGKDISWYRNDLRYLREYHGVYSYEYKGGDVTQVFGADVGFIVLKFFDDELMEVQLACDISEVEAMVLGSKICQRYTNDYTKSTETDGTQIDEWSTKLISFQLVEMDVKGSSGKGFAIKVKSNLMERKAFLYYLEKTEGKGN